MAKNDNNRLEKSINQGSQHSVNYGQSDSEGNAREREIATGNLGESASKDDRILEPSSQPDSETPPYPRSVLLARNHMVWTIRQSSQHSVNHRQSDSEGSARELEIATCNLGKSASKDYKTLETFH